MKILLSPAKSFADNRAFDISEFTTPVFEKEAFKISLELRKKSPKELSELMSISSKLAELNWQRNQCFLEKGVDADRAHPAIFFFDGDVYKGIDIRTFPENKINDLQERLRILSGLYGILKPLDVIQLYRLEMGTKMPFEKYSSIVSFWKGKITNLLNKELKDNDVLINLSSKEYASAVNFKDIKAEVITPEFRDYREGKYKMIGLFAKKARGMMTRYLIEYDIKNSGDMLGFSEEGYLYNEQLTETARKPVFTRG